MLLGAALATGCASVDLNQMQPTYATPIVASRAELPLTVVYSPIEFPDDATLTSSGGLSDGELHGVRSLVTRHLKRALESMFAHVTVVTDPHAAPPNAAICWVRFVSLGTTRSAGGAMVGQLEWSLSMHGPNDPRIIYSWSERAVGAREGSTFSQIIGAIEASLRSLLADMQAKNVVATLSAAPAAAAR